jgi:PAS domain-containing protein
VGQATFGETIDAVYRAAAEPQSWSAALEQVADHVGGSGAILVHNDFARGTGLIVNGRLRDDLGELYVREYCANPLVMAIAKHGQIGRPDLVSDLAGKGTVTNTAFHADILQPQRIVEQIALPHQAFSRRGSSSGGFAVMLAQRHIDDARAAVDRMARLAPHLSRALDLSLEVARHRDEGRRADMLLDALPTAAVLLDRTGRIIRANVPAEKIIESNDGVGTRSGMFLAGSLPDEERRLSRAILRALTFKADNDDAGFEQA